MIEQEKQQLIEEIRQYIPTIRPILAQFTETELTTVYIDGEWTIAQNIHHLADACVVLYIRLKLMLTESYPQLDPFDQDGWGLFPDAIQADLTDSLHLIEGIHERTCCLLTELAAEEFARNGFHTGTQQEISVESVARKIGWHAYAHLDQINQLIAEMKR